MAAERENVLLFFFCFVVFFFQAEDGIRDVAVTGVQTCALPIYLKNKSKLGTMFKQEGTKVMMTKCEENSMCIFNSKLIHSVPCHLPEERCSIAFNLVKK